MIGEFLYTLTPKDALTAPVIQRATFTSTSALAAASITIDSLPIPGEMIGLLTYVSAGFSAGAAQTATQAVIRLRTTDGNEPLRITEAVIDPAGQFGSIDRLLKIIMMPGEFVRFQGVFSAGAAVNTFRASAHILLMPKGNLQLR